MAGVNLTKGAIATVSEEGGGDGFRPVLQVCEVKAVNSQHMSSSERFRMSLSDGVHSQQAMLATQMNPLVKSGELQKGSVVQLNEFICNTIQGRRIIIVINLDVVVSKCDIIGEPKFYDSHIASHSRGSVPVQSSVANQPATAASNTQSHSGSYQASPTAGQSTIRTSLYQRQESVLNNNTANGPSFPSGANPSGNLGGHTQTVKSEQGSDYSNQQNSMNQNQRFSNSANSAASGIYHPQGNSYGRPLQPKYQQPPMYTNRGPVAKNEAPARIIPIAALNPYQGRWTIKARVTAKGELRRYNNPRGEGKVFSFDLLDSDGGEIRVTCFNMVADQFYDQIEVGKVYLISKGSLKPAQKNFNHLNNEYEIFLDSTSTIQACLEEDNTIPRQQFNFKQISEIESLENNSMVDVIGVVSSIGTAGTILRKNGTETQKRTLQLKDMSACSVEITLWGNFCNTEGEELQAMCDSGASPVLAVKAGRVSDFSGKSIGTISTSQLFINPDFPEAMRIRDWYNREGKSVAAISISRDSSSIAKMDLRKTVSQIKDEGLGRSEKPDWIAVKAAVTFIKPDNFCYTACPLMVGDRQCNKKVNNNGDGTWHCDRCEKTFPECDYRYLLQLQIQDHTGMTWVTAFQECGEEIMGVSAKELYFMKFDEQDDVRFSEVLRKVLFNQYLFKLKVKEETFSDEQRVKSTVVKAEKVNPASESKHLLGLIEKFSLEDLNGVSGNLASGYGMSSSGYDTDYKSGLQSGTNNYGGDVNANLYKMEPPNTLVTSVGSYGNSMSHSATRGGQLFCGNCGSSGHNYQNCPRAMNTQGQSFGGSYVNRASNASYDGANDSNVCFKCKQPGHWSRDCPGASLVGSTYGGGNAPGRYMKQQVGGF